MLLNLACALTYVQAHLQFWPSPYFLPFYVENVTRNPNKQNEMNGSK